MEKLNLETMWADAKELGNSIDYGLNDDEIAHVILLVLTGQTHKSIINVASLFALYISDIQAKMDNLRDKWLLEEINDK